MEDNFDLNDWEALSEGSRRMSSGLPLVYWLFIWIFIILGVVMIIALPVCIVWRIGQLIEWLKDVL